MIVAVVNFVSSFFSNTNFIFCGETPNEFLWHFHDTQDLPYHVDNVILTCSLSSTDEKMMEHILGVFDDETISKEELNRFLELGDSVCHVVEYLESDDALERMRMKYPDALYRPMVL